MLASAKGVFPPAVTKDWFPSLSFGVKMQTVGVISCYVTSTDNVGQAVVLPHKGTPFKTFLLIHVSEKFD